MFDCFSLSFEISTTFFHNLFVFFAYFHLCFYLFLSSFFHLNFSKFYLFAYATSTLNLIVNLWRTFETCEQPIFFPWLPVLRNLFTNVTYRAEIHLLLFSIFLGIITQSKSKTIITRSMLTISLIVFTDKFKGHVHTFHSKWYFITF